MFNSPNEAFFTIIPTHFEVHNVVKSRQLCFRFQTGRYNVVPKTGSYNVGAGVYIYGIYVKIFFFPHIKVPKFVIIY